MEENKIPEMNTKTTIIALEKQALELWNNGNPDGFIALSDIGWGIESPFLKVYKTHLWLGGTKSQR